MKKLLFRIVLLFCIWSMISISCHAQCWFKVLEHQCFESDVDCTYTADISYIDGEIANVETKFQDGWFQIRGQKGVPYNYTITGDCDGSQWSICDAGDFTQGTFTEPICRITRLDTTYQCEVTRPITLDVILNCICDTVVKTTYIEYDIPSTIDTIYECDIKPWTDIEILPSYEGCDSLVTYVFLNAPSYIEYIYTYGESSAEIVDVYETVYGCDSTIIKVVQQTDINEGDTIIQVHEVPVSIDQSVSEPIINQTPLGDCDTIGVYIPNAINPSGHSPNSLFKVFTAKPEKIVSVGIYNRWGGQLVHQTCNTNTHEFEWTGEYKNGIIYDTYVYKIILEYEDKSTKLFKGNFTIL